MKDYLGKEIKIGDRCIRPMKVGRMAELITCVVVNIDESRAYGDCIEVLSEGCIKTGWTYPRRLLVLGE